MSGSKKSNTKKSSGVTIGKRLKLRPTDEQLKWLSARGYSWTQEDAKISKIPSSLRPTNLGVVVYEK